MVVVVHWRGAVRFVATTVWALRSMVPEGVVAVVVPVVAVLVMALRVVVLVAVLGASVLWVAVLWVATPNISLLRGAVGGAVDGVLLMGLVVRPSSTAV